MAHRAAVLGRPIAHSKSPQLHGAGYAALGLDDWEYVRVDCGAEELPALVAAAGPEWAGFSVTMPGKFAALETADESTERARLVGSANTLVHLPDGGWLADNTDCDGVAGALAELGADDLPDGRAVVVGAGGTARPALWALARAGVRHLDVVARSERALAVEPLAAALGMEFTWVRFDDGRLPDIAGASDVLVSTVPSDALQGVATYLARAPRILDVIYDPWPTPLARAAGEVGHPVVGGLSMLLHQGTAQFERFTGHAAPVAEMRAALGA
ncbi:shikimate dehydrogenase [Corynebacterium sp. 335C]